jgi:flagellar biosynthetic protein FliQ
MAEMKNQDPTQPMDPSQMVSQLATVSEVGQAVQTNTTLNSLLTATSLSQAEQLVGPGRVGQRHQHGRGRHPDQWRDRFARQWRERAVNEGDAIDLVQSAIWMVVVGAGPCVGAAMAVGVVIALLQALTQIQEMTLTFVPKMIAVFVAASLTASFVGGKFSIFTQSVYARIEQGYK